METAYWVGLPVYRKRQLQSVLNAAVGLVFRLKTSDHISVAQCTHQPSLEWLRVLEQIQYKLAVMEYEVLHRRATSNLWPFVRVADVSCRRALRSVGTSRVLVPPVRSTTVGNRSFTVAAPLLPDSFPDDVTSAESLSSIPK